MPNDWMTMLDEMEEWSREMDRFLEHIDRARHSRSRYLSPAPATPWRPAVNVYETADTFVVKADVGCAVPDDIHVRYDAGRLQVWGKRDECVPDNLIAVHRMEITFGPFAFEVPLPGPVDARRSDATLQSGLLEIRLPKGTPPPPQLQTIRIRPTETKEKTDESDSST